MIQEKWLFAAAAWLLLGLIADKICEWHAKKENRPYKKTVEAAAYIAGPVVIPIAMLWSIGKGILHLFKK